MSPPNHKRTTSSLAPPIFYVTKNLAIKRQIFTSFFCVFTCSPNVRELSLFPAGKRPNPDDLQLGIRFRRNPEVEIGLPDEEQGRFLLRTTLENQLLQAKTF